VDHLPFDARAIRHRGPTPDADRRNEIPNIKPYEQPVYWRDVGTIDAYFEAHKDVLGADACSARRQ